MQMEQADLRYNEKLLIQRNEDAGNLKVIMEIYAIA